ncbi:peptidoglycan DD-metalloendopeptidase family protein [Zooshikella ganghwensis]|uniref:peptidoglycan DD-metalloendopeptidase family protein n=1 Tax=Zooshikella ganghwensis TaxID=202772 RepID=UPI0019825582|nr:peptidoglycan DD-metalloendopeptidase family protein [Zooshikella ganghwensis]
MALTCSVVGAQAGEVFKYKDEHGKWVFTDKQPTSSKSEKLSYRAKESKKLKPKLYIETIDTENFLQVENPFFAPVEIEITSESFPAGKIIKVIPAKSIATLFTSKKSIAAYRVRWLLGDPTANEQAYNYSFPVFSRMPHTITQSFNGPFSHNNTYSRYAVDIGMKVGTYIAAARAGTVVSVKEDYHMSGTSNYFLDKANYVMVMHDDGTYATYAHILLGTAMVKPGDRVEVGERLARSGSSGFSTGPHLHFVIHKNIGFKWVSIPFNFIDDKGNGCGSFLTTQKH